MLLLLTVHDGFVGGVQIVVAGTEDVVFDEFGVFLSSLQSELRHPESGNWLRFGIAVEGAALKYGKLT